MVRCDQLPQSTVITLLPNRSASWAETRLFIFIICGVMLTIGAFWAFSGAWMILPFSGIEAGLVAFLFYRVCLATYHKQVITFANDSVLIQFGKHFPKRSWQLPLNSVYLALTEPKQKFSPVRLNVSDGKQSIELGAFLNNEDKQHALLNLMAAGLQIKKYQQSS